ncbi:pectate lyase [Simiduia litorea]|uniref:pectate lyase n=1 Tax=Simiduia litorea TaxID=1435348 RepID=UPI0036F42358
MKIFLTIVLSCTWVYPCVAQPEQDISAQWQAYFELSSTLKRKDQKTLAKELEHNRKAAKPPKAERFGFDAELPEAAFKTAEGKAIADIILSFQTPSGGWSKRVDMGQRPRRRGEAWGAEKSYQPTFDNYATTTQMRVLAKAFSATGDERYATSFKRGLDLVINAQMPQGCWPQSFPLDGGYHNHITYNDKSMVNILELLLSVAQRDYPWLAQEKQELAQAALLKGVNCILMTQYFFEPSKTFLGWGAQHDAFSLQPAQARAYEMPALSSQESAEIMLFLMALPSPPAVVVQAVTDAATWLEAKRIVGKRYDRQLGKLVDDEQAKPLWSRFYSLTTGEPIFGDRDGQVYDRVERISLERRQGYAWYSTGASKALTKFQQWKTAHIQTPESGASSPSS